MGLNCLSVRLGSLASFFLCVFFLFCVCVCVCVFFFVCVCVSAGGCIGSGIGLFGSACGFCIAGFVGLRV